VVLASRIGLPVSTTHIAVGAVIGVGLARGVGAIDLRVIGGIVVSWLVTLPVGGILAALFFFTLKGMFT
jgi:PiT family inorganic phosphate transporter